MKEFPTIAFLRKELRYNLTKAIRPKILKAFIIGSEARGTATPKSDLDVAVVILKIRGKSSIQYTENFHSQFISEKLNFKWRERKLDFQFFFENDEDLDGIPKIEIS